MPFDARKGSCLSGQGYLMKIAARPPVEASWKLPRARQRQAFRTSTYLK
jgi:hypothetical protein